MRIYKFYKKDCAPCKMVQQFLENEGVSDKIINVNAYDDPDKAFDFGISSVPVTILVDDSGVEMKRVIGYNVSQLKELLQTYGG